MELVAVQACIGDVENRRWRQLKQVASTSEQEEQRRSSALAGEPGLSLLTSHNCLCVCEPLSCERVKWT